MLAIVFAALTFLQGLIKIGLNLYRNWIGESAVRWLRNEISHVAQRPDSVLPSGKTGGVEIAMVVAEVDPIDGFVGASLSDPILQIGILLSVFSYLIYLQPLMALVGILVFLPQCFLVPLIQGAINRRVGARIWVLRKISVMLVDTAERDETTNHSQSRRIDQVFRLNMSIFRLKFVLNFAMNWLNSLGTAIILGIGGYLVVQGRTEIRTVVAFVSGLAKINDPWSDLVNWYRDYRVIQARYRLVASAMRNADTKAEAREPPRHPFTTARLTGSASPSRKRGRKHTKSRPGAANHRCRAIQGSDASVDANVRRSIVRDDEAGRPRFEDETAPGQSKLCLLHAIVHQSEIVLCVLIVVFGGDRVAGPGLGLG